MSSPINLQPSPATQTIPQVGNFLTASAFVYGELGYVSGWNGTSLAFIITKADADASGRPAQWVAMQSIASGAIGKFAAMDQSLVGILDTSGGAVGDPVYLSATAGAMTLTAPTGAARVQRVGFVTVVSATVGKVQLLPQNSLDDVLLTSIDFQGPANFTSASATALTVGRLGTTTPAFTVDASAGTSTAGLKVTAAALNGTVALVVTDTSGNTNLTINALGAGTIGIGSVSTGIVTITPAAAFSSTVTVTSASASALAVGRLGATTPALAVDASTVTQVTGILITGKASGSGAAIATQGGGAAEVLTLDAKGTGTIDLNSTGTGVVRSTRRFRSGLAGSATGALELLGTTSGTLSLTVGAAAGTWTMQLPAAVGAAGQQLTDAAGDGVCTWAAASLGAWKNDLGILSPMEALKAVLKAPTHIFTYNKEVLPAGQWDGNGARFTGIFAEEAPWAMHGERDGARNGIAFSPVNAVGYLRAAIEALNEKIERLERQGLVAA